MKRSLVGLSSVLTICMLTSLGHAQPRLPQSTDPSGCILEHVAVEAGFRMFQNDSLLPDGTGIAIGWDQVDGTHGTYLLDLATLERTPLHDALDNGATFSPDGKWIVNAVYVSENNTDIVLIDREKNELSYIAADESWDWLPSFSPDGTQIFFNSYRAGSSDIYAYTLESGELQQLTSNPTYEAHAKLSPDGKFMLYHEQVEGPDFNINLMELATGEVRQLTSSPREEGYASWSPDGRYIAYADDRDRDVGKPDIYVMDLAGNMVSRITDHPEKDAYPFWSPDGQYIYFNSYRGDSGVYRAPMSNMVHCKRG